MRNFAPSLLETYGPSLLELGYKVVPIFPGTKAPKVPEWQHADAYPELIKVWAQTHTGCGIRGPETVGVDLDIYDKTLVQHMITFTRELLGNSPHRVGLAPKALLPYRCEAPFKKQMSRRFVSPDGQKNKVEILADGQQFVVSHIHPDTGNPYTWHYSENVQADTLTWAHHELPPITEEPAQQIVAEFERQCLERGWLPEAPKPPRGPQGVSGGEDFIQLPCPEQERATVREALLSMPSDDRDLWQRMGHALKVEGETGWGHDLWLEWSATSLVHDPDPDQETWESFKPVRTDYRSILAEAQRRGWVNPRSNKHSAQDVANIERLAKLSSFDYERVRMQEAERLGIRVKALDEAVSKHHQDAMSDDVNQRHLPMPELWPDPVDGAVLLDEIRHTIGRFIVCDERTKIAATLWIAFTWFIDHVQTAPIAFVTAPEMRCGKSQLLSLIGKLCCRPLLASNITPAALFRAIEAMKPTLLLDEADTFLTDEKSELRGIINSGHTRGSAYVIRTVGEDFTPTHFSTWGAKAIAGIGTAAPTIMDRAIVLALRRKMESEKVERLRREKPEFFEQLASRLRRFAEDHGASVATADPEMPEALNDREQDNWEPLVAIADIAGGEWPAWARKAACEISAAATHSAPTTGTELLKDIRAVLMGYEEAKIHGSHLLVLLCTEKERAWASYNNGRELTQAQMARLLTSFGIRSKDVRLGGEIKKGYEVSAFEDAFRRYLDSSDEVVGDPVPEGAQV